MEGGLLFCQILKLSFYRSEKILAEVVLKYRDFEDLIFRSEVLHKFYEYLIFYLF